MSGLPQVRPLTQAQVDVLCAFKGFGRLEAPVWFVGMEEGGSNPALLHARALWDPVMDLKEAHVDRLGITRHHEKSRSLQSTWRPMCMLMRLMEQPELFPRRRDHRAIDPSDVRAHRQALRGFVSQLREYQAELLGRTVPEGMTFLSELLPIPKPAEHKYPFAELLPMWAGHEAYKKAVETDRKNLLRSLILENRPEMVVCYGKKFWASYEDLFDATTFSCPGVEQPELLPSWEKDEHGASYTKLKVGRAPSNSFVVLTEHLTRLGSNQMIAELAAFMRASR